jgi:hypothetical protein
MSEVVAGGGLLSRRREIGRPTSCIQVRRTDGPIILRKVSFAVAFFASIRSTKLFFCVDADIREINSAALHCGNPP